MVCFLCIYDLLVSCDFNWMVPSFVNFNLLIIKIDPFFNKGTKRELAKEVDFFLCF